MQAFFDFFSRRSFGNFPVFLPAAGGFCLGLDLLLNKDFSSCVLYGDDVKTSQEFSLRPLLEIFLFKEGTGIISCSFEEVPGMRSFEEVFGKARSSEEVFGKVGSSEEVFGWTGSSEAGNDRGCLAL